MYANYYVCRAGGDGGLGELLKLEPIKEASHSPPPPPGTKHTTKQTTSMTNPTTHDPSSSSQARNELVMQESGPAVQKKKDVTSKVRGTFKSPTGILAGDLGRNLSIMSPPSLQASNKLTALPKHMQVAQLGSKAVRSKGSSLLTSTAMRFHSGNDGLNSILDGSPDPIPGIHYAYGRMHCSARHTCIIVYNCTLFSVIIFVTFSLSRIYLKGGGVQGF